MIFIVKSKYLVKILLIIIISLVIYIPSSFAGFTSHKEEFGPRPYYTPPSPPTPTIDIPEVHERQTEETVIIPHYIWIEGNVLEKSTVTSELFDVPNNPVKGAIVGGQATDEDGFYKIYPPEGEYDLTIRYGDISALNANSSYNISDIMKFNGYDYAICEMPTSTSGETYDVIRREIIDSQKGASQVVIMLDASYSMTHEYTTIHGVEKTKFQNAIDSTKELIHDLLEGGDNIYIAIVVYAGNNFRAASLTKDEDFLTNVLDSLPSVDSDAYKGGTDFIGALEKAQDSFYVDESDPDYLDKCNRNIVMISDGVPSTDGSTYLYTDDTYDEIISKLYNTIGPNTKQKIHELLDEKIDIFSLVSHTDEQDEKDFIDYLFSEISSTFKMAEDEEDLAIFIREAIQEWILEQLEEVTEYHSGDQILVGEEDEERRAEVDNSFKTVFYNNHESNSLSSKSALFKATQDESRNVTNSIVELSEKTYMTASCGPYHIDAPADDSMNYDVVETREDENGEYEYTIHYRHENFGYTGQNIYIQRRQEFPLTIKVTATAMKIELNDGTTLSYTEREMGDLTPLLEVIDDDIAHGTTVFIEYTVEIKNNSSLQINHIELVDYLPENFMFVEDTPLLTDVRSTNKDSHWYLTKLESLRDDGYLEPANYLRCSQRNTDSIGLILDNHNEESDGFYLPAGGSFKSHFVLSRVIGLADDITGDVENEVEVLGYTNLGNRRMSYPLQNNLGSLLGMYPGDGLDTDFSRSSNIVLIVPPTGNSLIFTTRIVLIIVLAISLISTMVLIKKKNK